VATLYHACNINPVSLSDAHAHVGIRPPNGNDDGACVCQTTGRRERASPAGASMSRERSIEHATKLKTDRRRRNMHGLTCLLVLNKKRVCMWSVYTAHV